MSDKNLPLRADVRMLGEILGETMKRHGGRELFETEERIRALSKSLRSRADRRTERELLDLLRGLDLETAIGVIRAFAVYFQLTNIAEQHHRVRRRRFYALETNDEPQPGSLADLFTRLEASGVKAETVRRVIEGLRVQPVITAHPTEAVRRSLLEKHRRIADLLGELDRKDLPPLSREALRAELEREVEAIWLTDELRRFQPSVLDEVTNALSYFDVVFFDAVPDFLEELHRAAGRFAGLELPETVAPLRFGSWVGGDRDGNPFVTPEVTWATLLRQRELLFSKYVRALGDLGGRLSESKRYSPPSPRLLRSLKRDRSRFPETARTYESRNP
ncbi:MAG: phosphoenolpyruvate carboxylase, partial [Vicinamibacteria bacterium]